jgi:TonB family protein
LSARTALGAPLALSLVGHAALLAVLAGIGLIVGSPVRPVAERVVPVKRAADLPAPTGQRLRVEIGEPAPGLPPAEPDAATVALDTADPRYRPYLSGVKQRIWERWSAPGLPEGAVAQGALVVEFTLTRSGRLAASEVRETSGNPALDRAALDAVARAVPFTPLPASIVGAALRVRARFVYD